MDVSGGHNPFQDLTPGSFPQIASALGQLHNLYLAIVAVDGEIRAVNRGMAEFLECEAPLLVGRNIKEFLASMDVDLLDGFETGTERLLNFLPESTIPRTVRCFLIPVDSVIILVAEPMLKDNRFLVEELLGLNNRMTVLSRENIRKGRQLQGAVQALSAEIEQRRKSEERFRVLVESAPDAIFVQTEGSFAYANPAMLKLFGASSQEQLAGRPIVEMVDSSCRDILEARIRSVISDKNPTFASELVFHALDGRVIEVESIGMPISYENKDGALVFLRDITERKRAEKKRLALEQRLQQAQKAESLARMAGAIAHNFNNMLGLVMGNLELAQFDAPDESELKACIEEAMHASQRAAKISRFMLTYLGQEIGKAEILDLASALREACSLVSPTLPQNLRLKAEIPSRQYAVKACGAHLANILTNLIENAGEAIGKQEGEISLIIDTVSGSDIHEPNLRPRAWKPGSGEHVRILIADTGCGIPPEHLDNIFDPFFSTKFAGRGMGLAVVLGLLRSNDGAIAVESLPGRGTTSALFFPLLEQKEPAASKEPASADPPAPGAGLVLVVEDEDAFRGMAEAILK